ncbi:hypothetical protein FE254_10170 [Ectopseudomonas guguanensis]|uniref:DUF6270 domain-containing protein n=1 Tax=Ectopseudomonas guguanensis TaxID=1198456 RepID=UPI002574B3BF|nr:DUF6270 domain-containing protein [Pseudomonas guguanensis]WJH56519.1 hypothetical protein FE254_10170 [Pseudomonas guguanensis]
MSNNIIYALESIDSSKGFNGRADICVSEGQLSARFNGDEDSYLLRFELPEKYLAAGVQARLYLEGWQELHYAAVGYTEAPHYRHIKASNMRQGAWIEFGFTHQDVIWKLQNGMAAQGDAEIGDIRLFIKGRPSALGATLRISGLAVLRESKFSATALPRQPLDKRLLETLYGYLRKGFRDYESSAKAFMDTGKCPMPGGKLLDWPPAGLKPDALESVNTFRFAWHGLHPVINLLLSAEQTGAVAPVFAARALVDNWLDQSYYVPDEDAKFTWYDHGTAERLLAFILMWAKAVVFGLDERFMQRLGEAILSHARLLHSEAFYAYHQPDRYHNHAWFQDAALAAVALALPSYGESSQWLANAISRFEDQLDKLIVRDGGFAIFVENSIGYHHGVQRLAELVGALVELSGKPTEIPAVAKELIAWSDFLRYPDGRVPAQGDTFRLPARTGAEIRRGIAWSHPGCTVLPKAGYAVVKGNHDGKPWMLCLFNTSLSKTHKHEDNLSITFWFDGIEWLIDPSFYSHEYAEVTSSYLRSAKAHNVIVSDAAGYSIEPGRAQLTDISSGNIYGVVATSLCVEGLEMRRSVSYRADDSALGFQDAVLPLDGEAPAAARLNYVFGENVCCETQKTGFVLSHPDSIYRLAFDFDGEVSVTSLKTCAGLGFMQACEVGGAVVSCGESNHLGWKLSLQGDSGQREVRRSSKEHGISTSASKLGKVLLIGSCVTRDALSLIECEEIKYYARTGLISLASPPVLLDENLFNFEGVGNFERRMILSDFDKRAVKDINCGDFDVVILDFIDERFDVSEVSGGGFVTRSNYLIQSGLLSALDERVHKRFTLDETWEHACINLLGKLRARNYPVILHKAWWAESFYNHDAGVVQRFASDQLAVVQKYNKLLARYYDVVERNYPGLMVVEVSRDLLFSDYAHKWGRDYFHYGVGYYKELAEKICRLL